MSLINEQLDQLPQFEIEADRSFCLNVTRHGFKARIMVSVQEFEIQLVSGKTRVKLNYMNSDPIDDKFELYQVEA